MVADKKMGRDKAIRNSAITMLSEVRPFTDEDNKHRKPFAATDGADSLES